MQCFKSGLDTFLKRSIQTSVVNGNTDIYKPIAPAGNTAQLDIIFPGHSDYYINLITVRLKLHNKLVKSDGSYIENAEPNAVVCVKIFFAFNI